MSTTQRLPHHQHHHEHFRRVSGIFHLPHVISSRRSSNASKASIRHLSTSSAYNDSRDTVDSSRSYINSTAEESSGTMVPETLKFDHIQRRGRKPPPLTIDVPPDASDRVSLPAPSINNVEFNNIRGLPTEPPSSFQRHRLSLSGISQKQGTAQSNAISKQHRGTLYGRLRSKTQNALHIKDDIGSLSANRSNEDKSSGSTSYSSTVVEPFANSSSSLVRQQPIKKLPGLKTSSSTTRFGNLLTRTASRFHRQSTMDSNKGSIFNIKSNNSSATLGEKNYSDTATLLNVQNLKGHDNLSIQTSLLPSVSKDTKSPLARTSKEVERIAAYRLNNGSSDTLPGKVQAATQPAKNWMKAHSHMYLLRSRKDSLKSSSNSNSKVTRRGQAETRYSFRPSAANNTFSTNDLQSVLKELEELGTADASGKNMNSEDYDAFSIDRENVADESWAIFCSLVNPLFKGDRLKAPMEEINKLVYLYQKLRSPGNIESSNNAMQWNHNEASVQSTAMSMDSYNNRLSSSPYTPITAPSPTFGFPSNTSSPAETNDVLNTNCVNGSRRIYEEVQEFLKVGMTTTLSLLYYDQNDKIMKIRSLPGSECTNNSRSFTNTADMSFSSYLSDDNFEKSCLLLWNLFYRKIYFYLQGVFLPINKNEAKASALGGYNNGSDQTISDNDVVMSDLILAAFRDQVIIPLYQVNRQVETENERKREHDGAIGAMVSNVNFRETRIVDNFEDADKSDNTAIVNADKSTSPNDDKKANENSTDSNYLQGTDLLRCFTILNGVQTHDTNQKIIENLMQQMRERCLMHRSSTRNEQETSENDDDQD